MSSLTWRGPEAVQRVKNALPFALTAAAFVVETHAKHAAPVDTGNLRNSITHQPPQGDTVLVGTPVEYAVYQEYGTRFMGARPYLRPAVDEHKPEILAAFAAQMRKALV